MKKIIIAAAVAAMAAGGAVALRTIVSQSDPIFEANVEALTRNESGQMYLNAKLSYCTDPAGAIGCKGALFRNCTGVFCID